MVSPAGLPRCSEAAPLLPFPREEQPLLCCCSGNGADRPRCRLRGPQPLLTHPAAGLARREWLKPALQEPRGPAQGGSPSRGRSGRRARGRAGRALPVRAEAAPGPTAAPGWRRERRRGRPRPYQRPGRREAAGPGAERGDG